MTPHVIILGAGISGLTAAHELLKHGARVTIVEAKDRTGGRIHTRPVGAGLVELGAEFVHDESRVLEQAIVEHGLTTREVPDRNQVFRNGRFDELPLWEIIGEILRRIDPRAPDQSFRDFVESAQLPADQRELALGFVRGFDAADPARVGAHALRRAQFSMQHSGGSQQLRIKGGYGALVAAIEHDVRAAGATLRFGAKARRIEWKPRKVEVGIETGAGTDCLRGSQALITLPLGALKKDVLEFVPALHHKREAIDSLHFGNALKLTFVFDQVWWREHDFGFIHSFAHPLPTWWSHPDAPLLTGWAGGPKADVLTDHTLEQLTELGLRTLSQLFHESAATLKRRLLSVHTHNWAHDPDVRGAYSYLPVRGLDLPKVLAAAIDETLFFAGEATALDAQMGTVTGAMETGVRAAHEIMNETGSPGN